MEINRKIRRFLKDKRIQKIKEQAEQKIGRTISDEDFLEFFNFALNKVERDKKKNV